MLVFIILKNTKIQKMLNLNSMNINKLSAAQIDLEIDNLIFERKDNIINLWLILLNIIKSAFSGIDESNINNFEFDFIDLFRNRLSGNDRMDNL